MIVRVNAAVLFGHIFRTSAYTIPMKTLKCDLIIGIIVVIITGTLAHFVYEWTGKNEIAGLFVPVNESVWEHMKLLFFPMLLYALFATRRLKGAYPCIGSSFCFGILAGTLLIPLFFYAYTAVCGRNIFILDIATFLISVILAFRLTFWLAQSCRTKSYAPLLYALTAALFVCFAVFTQHPPDGKLFEDPTVSQGSSVPPHTIESSSRRQSFAAAPCPTAAPFRAPLCI